jgi:hypothetical protein
VHTVTLRQRIAASWNLGRSRIYRAHPDDSRHARNQSLTNNFSHTAYQQRNLPIFKRIAATKF